jgi:hypothetical protein
MNNATENKKVSSREVFTDGKDGQRDQPNLTTRKQKQRIKTRTALAIVWYVYLIYIVWYLLLYDQARVD